MYTIPEFNPGGGSQLMDVSSFNYGGAGGTSSNRNQFMGFPAMTSSSSGGSSGSSSFFPIPAPAQSYPGIVPPATGFTSGATASGGGDTRGAGIGGNLPGGAHQGRTLDPQQTQQWVQYLLSQLGQGVTPFDLSALLPSTGQATVPGTLTAPENPVLQSLQNFYLTGQGGPLPGVLPMWQSEMQSMNIPIQEQLANIKEQFGARGALGSSEMAQAMETFGAQTAKDQEALLGQLTLQALPGMQSFGEGIQNLDQQAISNLYQEFIRTQPQYNPMVGLEQQFASTFPPIYTKQGGAGQAAIGSAGDIMGGLASLIPVLAGLCWVSAEVFNENIKTGRRTSLVRDYLINHVRNTSLLGAWFVDVYRRYGKAFAETLREDSKLRNRVKELFEDLYGLALDWRYNAI